MSLGKEIPLSIKMEPVDFKIRDMRKEDITQVLEIHRETGWHIGSHSIETWYEVDPLGFKVAATDSGEVLGVCAAVRQHENLHFVGLYIVRKKYQGIGIGSQIWNACMDYIEHRNVGLNSVPEMLDKYKNKCGFSVNDDMFLVNENNTLEEIWTEKLLNKVPEGVSILPFHESQLPFMFDFDYKISGFDRHLAIELNCKEKDSNTLVAFKNGICVGFGTVKRSVLDVPQISPLYADEAIVAEVMMSKLLLSYRLKKGFSMVTFASNKPANDLIKKIGCPLRKQLFRLYKRIEDNLDFHNSIAKIFSNFDIEFSPF